MSDSNVTGDEGKNAEQPAEGSTPSLDIKGEKTVGEILLAAREGSGLSLESVSLDTKIPRKSLEYLETDNFEALPSRVYVRGFLRTYAGLLGLDVQQVLGRFDAQVGQTHKSRGDRWEIEEAVVEEELESPKIFRRFVMPYLAALLVVAAIVWAVWMKTGRDARPPKDEPTAESTAAAPDSSAGDSLAGGAPDSAAIDAKEVADLLNAPGAAGGGEGAVRGGSAAIEPSRAQAGGKKINVRLIANSRDTTWFDLVVYSTSESGPQRNSHDFILGPDQVRTFQAIDSILFRTVGNAGGFYIERDDVRLPVLGERRQVMRNVRLTGEGVFR